MLHSLKKRLYFAVAAYFAFWARLVLIRWKPRIIVITGSSGKTTLLHMVEAQLGSAAAYSHHANSSIGLPMLVLGMNPNVLSKKDWPWRFLLAPFKAWRAVPDRKLFVVEADCDRPHEGKFLAQFLKPEVVLWISISNTHSMNFDRLVKENKFATHTDAIAYEFGYFVEHASKLVLLNSDQPTMMAQNSRNKIGAAQEAYSLKAVSDYRLENLSTNFTFGQEHLTLPGLHPKEVGISLQMVSSLLDYLAMPLDPNYKQLTLPPGRTNVLSGKKDSILIDSTYNTGLGATEAVLKLVMAYPSQQIWLIVGDILEQGKLDAQEHQKLAELLKASKAERVILLGRRTHQYTYPLLLKSLGERLVSFESAGEVLTYITDHLKGGEVLVFKGAQGLEGVIEQLLANPKDANQLVRRGATWTKRRQAWGLPQ